MPRFSVCVSSYNDAEYLPLCIKSVTEQSFSDFELIIVNDGSEDDSGTVLQTFANVDSRIVPINKEVNQGVHRGRMDAVAAATGDYILFLDSDDCLAPGTFEALDSVLTRTNADYLHFGMRVIPGTSVDVQTANSLAQQANANPGGLSALDVMRASYLTFDCDWRVTQRVFSASLAKRAFFLMDGDGFGVGEDAYENFVLCALASRIRYANSIIGYEYYLGRGGTGFKDLDASSWRANMKAYMACSDAAMRFAGDDRNLLECAASLRKKLIESGMNDWNERLCADERACMLSHAIDLCGNEIVATHLMRFARDEAYAALMHDEMFDNESSYYALYEQAKDLAGNLGVNSKDYLCYYVKAKSHIEDLRRRASVASYSGSDIRIFVSTHKNVNAFDSVILQPVQVGCALRNDRFSWALHDDEGPNISQLNAMYCELTTQYWAWKNTSSSYVGFCHYRRYFDFNPERHKENEFGEIIDGSIDEASQAKYLLDDMTIADTVRSFDVIATPSIDVCKFMGPGATIRSHYAAAPHLHVEDLDRVMDIVVERDASYKEDVKTLLCGHTARFCNMFIMRRDIFDEYCSWMFPILEEFCRRTDMSRYSKEGLRTPGHLSERLLNIFLLHNERLGRSWRIGELQCVHFEHPEYQPDLEIPIKLDDARPVIPIVFAADNNYVPMLATTVYSAMANASRAYRYDVVVLHRDISWENRDLMSGWLGKLDGVSVRFHNVGNIIGKYKLTTSNAHISVETYYRFLVQELLPFYDKVIYLDSDLIVKGDISELFSVELGDKLLAAVPDIDFAGNVNMKDGKRVRYAREVLHLEDPFAYFQAGVLLLNTRAMRDAHPMAQWLEYASDDKLIYNDQDVLNAHCEGRVVFLDFEWNVMIDCAGRIGAVFSFAPGEMYDAFLRSRSQEKIVHYAGFEKPWNTPDCDRAELYWSYARRTPFYESLLARFVGMVKPEVSAPVQHERAISQENAVRGIADFVLPLGSNRREVAKAFVRGIRGRK